MNQIRKYEQYHDSGVEWIGEIPENWTIRKLKYVSNIQLSNVDKKSVDGEIPVLLCNYVDVYYNNVISDDIEFMEATAKFDQINRFQLRRDDILLTKDSESPNDIAISAWVKSDLEGVLCGYHLAHIRPFNSINGRYLFYCLDCIRIREQYYARANGVTRFGLSKDDIGTALCFVPTLSEQEHIAKFLDQQTMEIDSLVSEKESLCALLEEQRLALITEIVTKGLRKDNARMKESGIDWIGDVPSYWEIKKVKYLSDILRGKFSHRPRNDPSLYDGEYPFIQTGDVSSSGKYLETYSQTLNERGFAVSKLFPRGTLVMTIAANIGDLSILNFEACFPDSIVGLVPKRDIDLNYLYYNLTAMKKELLRTATVNTQMNLNIELVGGLLTCCPPHDEQVEIANYLDQKVLEIDTLQQDIAQQIECMREYRQSLIFEAVTGKIDVRETVVESTVV